MNCIAYVPNLLGIFFLVAISATLWPSLIVPLSVVRSAYGSVNGRFFPYRQIITEAVFSIEEDTCLPSVELIERAFEVIGSFKKIHSSILK